MAAERERHATGRAPIARRLRASAVSNAASVAASLATYAAVTRWVEPAEYGRASLILAAWGLASSATDWCGETMMRFGPVELARHGSLRTTLSTRALFALPALALLLPAAPLYLAVARGWSAPMLCLTDVYLVAAAALGMAQWSAVAAQRFGPLALANALVRAAPLVAILLLRAAGRTVRAEALATASFAGVVVGALLLFAALRPLVGLVRPDRALLRAMWRYCRPVLFAAPSFAATSYIDPIILQRSVSNADVGRYQLAYLTVTLFGLAGASFNGVLSPELVTARARNDGHAVDRYRRATQPWLALALGLAAFAGACVAAPAVHALLPARWAAAADTVALLTVAGGLLLGVWSFHPLITVTDSVWALQLAAVAGALTNVGLDLALAPRAGAEGVALANVAAWAVQLAVLAQLLHWRIRARRAALALIAGAVPVLLLLVAHAAIAARAAAALALLLLAAAAARRAWRRDSP